MGYDGGNVRVVGEGEHQALGAGPRPDLVGRRTLASHPIDPEPPLKYWLRSVGGQSYNLIKIVTL
jgi:hypothetical protein